MFLSGLAVLAASVSQQPPPVRPLAPANASSIASVGDALSVRHLTNGLLVHDIRAHRMLLFDAALATFSVVADNVAMPSGNISSTGALLAYRGDSSVLVDGYSMLVIDPAGNLTGRVMSVPRSQDAGSISNWTGAATFDAEGRLMYRGPPRTVRVPPTRSSSGSLVMSPPSVADTAPVLRIAMDTRVVDTVGFVRVPETKWDVMTSPGSMTMRSIVDPLPVVDEWAVLSDGSVAFVRGRDYHKDFVRRDGSRGAAPRIPFQWRRLSDADRAEFLDSAIVVRTRATGRAGAPGAQAGGGAGGGGRGAGEAVVQRMVFVAASELPDYQPVFLNGFVRADFENRVWIRTIPTQRTRGGLVYDVIGSDGALVDRVQVPADRTIIGFGPGGIVYLRVGSTGGIERASFK